MKIRWPLLTGLACTGLLSLLLLTGILSLVLHLWPQYFRGRATDYEIYIHQNSQIGHFFGKRNIVIGDSRGNCHFDPQRFGKSWLNLSLPGSTPVEGYFSLQRFMAKGNRVDTAILFYGLDFLESKNVGFFEKLVIPHRAIDLSQLKELEELEKKWGMLFQGPENLSQVRFTYLQWKRRLTFQNFPLAYQANFFIGLRDMTVKREKIDEKSKYVRESLPQTKGHILFGRDSAYSKQPKRIQSNENFTLYAFNRHYLQKIFQLTHEHNTKVIMVIPPWNDTTLNSPAALRYFQQAQQVLEELMASYPHVRLVTSPRSLPNNCFGDESFHLNQRGVERYSQELRKHVFLSEYLPGNPVRMQPDLD